MNSSDHKPLAPRHHIGPTPIHPHSHDRRTVVGLYGCLVYGYPSTGGVIIRANADLVELIYLGLDRLDPPEKRIFGDQEAEDTFCRELRKMGGKWWESKRRFRDVWFKDGDGKEPTAEELRVWFLGWPDGGKGKDAGANVGGGVLVLEYESGDAMPDDIGRLRMAVTMQERCQLMTERFGARYFDDPAMCPGLAELYERTDIRRSSEQVS